MKNIDLIASRLQLIFPENLQPWLTNKGITKRMNEQSNTNRDGGKDMTAGEVVSAVTAMLDPYVFCSTIVSATAEIHPLMSYSCSLKHSVNATYNTNIYSPSSFSFTAANVFYLCYIPKLAKPQILIKINVKSATITDLSNYLMADKHSILHYGTI